jgi:hypothetical protein
MKSVGTFPFRQPDQEVVQIDRNLKGVLFKGFMQAQFTQVQILSPRLTKNRQLAVLLFHDIASQQVDYWHNQIKIY